jgi:uncharacterized protein (TIGR03790 family)
MYQICNSPPPAALWQSFPRRMLLRTAVTFLAVLTLPASNVRAQSVANVLVVANDASPASLEIARHYVAVRHIPEEQLLHVTTSTTDQMVQKEFDRDIEAPIAKWLAEHSAHDRILYIVLTTGIPLRVAGTSGPEGTIASVDSELTLLYRRLTGKGASPNGPIPNPYYLGNASLETARPFSHATRDIYLVTRLDGFTVADALALIDRGVAPTTTGVILLDGSPAPRDVRNEWLAAAADRLQQRGLAQRVVLDTTDRTLQNQTGVLGYYSWGSNDPALAARAPTLTFVPGALASMFLSTDARTLVEPPAEWKPGAVQNNFAGSSQSLIGDLVRSGVTGVSGQVAEPTLGGAIRPDILFPAYLAGFNLAESFYLAMPFLSWQTVIIGDPLCAPFRPATLTVTDSDPPLDPDTELPAHFSTRRMASIPGLAVSPSLKLLLRAETRSNRGDAAGAVEALNQVMAANDATPGSKISILAAEAWREMAANHQDEGRYSEANDFYRRLLAGNPNDIFALNNLAYNLAAHLGQPREALPLAVRAAELAPGHPFVMHTLGWTHHLLGNNAEALKLLEPVVQARSGDADMRFHIAIVYAAVGRMEDAANALKLALSLNPALRERPEVRELQRKLSAEK